MELLLKRVTNLLKIKSIVTLTLTAVFAYMAVLGRVSTDQFLTIFTVVISFFFGTQADRREDREKVVGAESATTTQEQSI